MSSKNENEFEINYVYQEKNHKIKIVLKKNTPYFRLSDISLILFFNEPLPEERKLLSIDEKLPKGMEPLTIDEKMFLNLKDLNIFLYLKFSNGTGTDQFQVYQDFSKWLVEESIFIVRKKARYFTTIKGDYRLLLEMQEQSWTLIDRIRQEEENSEIRKFLYAQLKEISEMMGISPPLLKLE